MSATQIWISTLAALAAGVGLLVAAAVMGDEAMAIAGAGLVCLFTGGVAIKRPKDV